MKVVSNNKIIIKKRNNKHPYFLELKTKNGKLLWEVVEYTGYVVVKSLYPNDDILINYLNNKKISYIHCVVYYKIDKKYIIIS